MTEPVSRRRGNLLHSFGSIRDRFQCRRVFSIKEWLTNYATDVNYIERGRKSFGRSPTERALVYILNLRKLSPLKITRMSLTESRRKKWKNCPIGMRKMNKKRLCHHPMMVLLPRLLLMLNREKNNNSHANVYSHVLFLFPENCQGAMKCFTAAITLWLAAVILQIHAEVSLLSRLASTESNANAGLISISLDVIGFWGFVIMAPTNYATKKKVVGCRFCFKNFKFVPLMPTRPHSERQVKPLMAY